MNSLLERMLYNVYQLMHSLADTNGFTDVISSESADLFLSRRFSKNLLK